MMLASRCTFFLQKVMVSVDSTTKAFAAKMSLILINSCLYVALATEEAFQLLKPDNLRV